MKYAENLLTIAAFVAIFFVLQGKIYSVGTNSSTLDGETTQKAASLTAVTTKTCPPCKKLKPIIKRLRDEGYMCVNLNYRDYTGPEKIKSVPTLLYFDKDGNLIDKEVGLQTYEHIKDKLIPAYKIS